MRHRLLRLASLWLFATACLAAQAQRVVIIKADGVPADLLDTVAHEKDPATGKSALPWIDHVFYQRGVRVANFYTRGISLSAPAWSLLDTGQHLVIRGNVEFDRYTGQAYDYLNFFPFYIRYALSRRVDMPGVEVLDDAGVPLLIDRFPYTNRYQSFQLLQRGVRWTTLERGLKQHFAGMGVREILDEWQAGIELGSTVGRQTERELIQKLQDPQVRYLDIFTGEFDHVAHLVRDPRSQRHALQQLDALVGRLWNAIQQSPLAGETVLVLVSDHGMSTDPNVYSQGFSLVDWLRSAAGGAQHVLTNRHPLQDYKLKGLDPFVSRVVTPSDNHPYLREQAEQYPTVLLDLDGNERASVHFRNNDLNRLHVLLRQLARRELPSQLRLPAIRAVQKIIASHREEWQTTRTDLEAELGAVRRAIESLRALVAAEPKKWPVADQDAGRDKEARRQNARLEIWREAERSYTDYLHSLDTLLTFRCDRCELSQESILRLIRPRAMGDRNSLANLRHYVIGPAPTGLVLTSGGELDGERSFRSVDYLAELKGLAVRNQAQPTLGNKPVDFIALRIPREALAGLPESQRPTGDAVWLYRGETAQALLLRRETPGTAPEILYLPVTSLREDSHGAMHWDAGSWRPGLPLELWEDPAFAIPPEDRPTWLTQWHTERDWLRAVHQSRYSNGIIGLLEHFGPISIGQVPLPPGTSAADARLLQRWELRRRFLAEPDLLVLANQRWNFNARGFNPGGNHGSFFRQSTHGILLFSGNSLQPGEIVEPYDSLSFVPTLVHILGGSAQNFPGAIIPVGPKTN